MKKTAAILTALAVISAAGATAYAENGGAGNLVDDAESIVDGVVGGAEDIVGGAANALTGDGNSEFSDDDGSVTPGNGSGDIADESMTDNSGESSDDGSVNSSDNSMGIVGNQNVNTGVPVIELAALGTAALGGLAAMAATVRRRK